MHNNIHPYAHGLPRKHTNRKRHVRTRGSRRACCRCLVVLTMCGITERKLLSLFHIQRTRLTKLVGTAAHSPVVVPLHRRAGLELLLDRSTIDEVWA